MKNHCLRPQQSSTQNNFLFVMLNLLASLACLAIRLGSTESRRESRRAKRVSASHLFEISKMDFRATGILVTPAASLK